MPDDNAPSFVDSLLEPNDPLDQVRSGADESGGIAPAGPDKGEGADGSKIPPATVTPDPEIGKLREDFDKVKDELFTTKQQIAYWQGEASRARQPETKVDDAPKPFVFNRDDFNAAMEKDPGQAIFDLVKNYNDSSSAIAQRNIESNVNGRLTQNQRAQQVQQQFQAEAREVNSKYSDLIGVDDKGKSINPEFDREAFDYSQARARDRGAEPLPPNVCRQLNVPIGTLALMPGDFRAAADAVYGEWARAGKLPAKTEAPVNQAPQRSLRQIIDQVPRSDNLGNGRRNGASSNGAPKSIDDLMNAGHYTAREALAQKNLIKDMGWDEGRFVANVLEATRNGELDGR